MQIAVHVVARARVPQQPGSRLQPAAFAKQEPGSGLLGEHLSADSAVQAAQVEMPECLVARVRLLQANRQAD